MFWLLRNFFYKRVSSGQTLFWLTGLAGGMVLALFPSVIHWVSAPVGRSVARLVDHLCIPRAC